MVRRRRPRLRDRSRGTPGATRPTATVPHARHPDPARTLTAASGLASANPGPAASTPATGSPADQKEPPMSTPTPRCQAAAHGQTRHAPGRVSSSTPPLSHDRLRPSAGGRGSIAVATRHRRPRQALIPDAALDLSPTGLPTDWAQPRATTRPRRAGKPAGCGKPVGAGSGWRHADLPPASRSRDRSPASVSATSRPIALPLHVRSGPRSRTDDERPTVDMPSDRIHRSHWPL